MPTGSKVSSEIAKLSGAAYLLLVVFTAAVLGFWWKASLIAELAVVAWLLHRGTVGKGGVRVLAGLGAVRFCVAAPIALFAHPVSAALQDMTFAQMASMATSEMLLAAAQILWSMTPVGVLFAAIFALLALPALGKRGRHGWPAFVAVAAMLPLISAFETVSPDSAPVLDQATLSKAAGVQPFRLAGADLSRRQYPTALAATGSFSRVTFVMLESVGALNLSEHLEKHPDSRMARLVRQGLYYERVLSPSNASHMAQPAILTSHEYSKGVHAGKTHVPRHPPRQWGFAEHFAAKGWLTLMQSSQDETWLGMDVLTMSKAFDEAKHAKDARKPSDTYVDSCGTRKKFDSVTVEEYDTRLARETGPVFSYLNLQNTHWPYVVESDGDKALATVLDCKDQHFGPAWKLAVARRRYTRALDENLTRLADFIDRHQDTLFVITGDHGESMLPGEQYGHAHEPSPDQMETFALFVGPGIEAEHVTTSISGLDLLPTTIALVSPEDAMQMPPDIHQGMDARAYDDGARPLLSVSYGLRPTSYAVDLGEFWLRTSAEGRTCENRSGQLVDVEKCDIHRQALAYWLSCKTSFYALEDHEQWFEPCWRMTRERFSVRTRSAQAVE